MLLDGLLVELAGERDDLSVVQLAARRSACGVVLPHPLELHILLGAEQLRFIEIRDAERELDFAAAHQGDVPLGHTPPEPEKFASGILPRLNHTKTHRGATFVYHRSFSESLISRLKLSFQRLSTSSGGEGGIPTPFSLANIRLISKYSISYQSRPPPGSRRRHSTRHGSDQGVATKMRTRS
jgi:hypothetical protein